MSNTISTSTNASATGYTPSQLVAMSASGDALVFWFDGTNVKWSYASSPYSSWTTASLVTSIGSRWQAGLYKLSNNDVLLVTGNGSGNTVSYYFTYSSGGHSWSAGSAVSVVTGNVNFNGGSVAMDADAQGRIWAIWQNNSSVAEVYFTSNNGTSWTASTTITLVGGGIANGLGLAYCGNYIVVVYVPSGGTYSYQRIDAHSASLGSWSAGAVITNTGLDNASNAISFRGAPNSNYGVLVGDEFTAIPAQYYNANTDTWSTVTNIGASTSDTMPTLVSDGTNLYCLWCKQAAANNFSLVYKKWTASTQTWDSASTQLEASGTNIAWPNGGYGDSILGFVYTVGTASPWTVTFDSLNFAPAAPVATGPKPRYITRGLLSTIIPDDVTQPLAYKERGIGGTIIYEIRTFIPRALGGTYIPETWRMMPRAFGARFIQSLDQFKDISTRFRLKSANQLKDISTRFILGSGTQSIRDIASRFRLMSANQLKDVATRFRLKSADQLKDIVTRFRLKSADQLKDIQSRFRLKSADQLKDIVTRFRLKSADQLKDIASRFRLRSADQQKDVASRFRLMSANQLKDIVSRFRLKSADQLKDITTRFILATPGQRLKDITSRFRLKSADQLKDIASRFRLKSADQLKDVQSRFRLMSANQLKDIVSRFRLMSANQVKDVASRFRLRSANQLKDIQSRFRVMSANQLRDISTRLRLKSANQLRDIASRFVLHGVGAFSNRDIATRFVLIVPSNAIWITRDGRISWLTRDDKAAWDTRDDLAAWKTR